MREFLQPSSPNLLVMGNTWNWCKVFVLITCINSSILGMFIRNADCSQLSLSLFLVWDFLGVCCLNNHRCLQLSSPDSSSQINQGESVPSQPWIPRCGTIWLAWHLSRRISQSGFCQFQPKVSLSEQGQQLKCDYACQATQRMYSNGKST